MGVPLALCTSSFEHFSMFFTFLLVKVTLIFFFDWSSSTFLSLFSMILNFI